MLGNKEQNYKLNIPVSTILTQVNPMFVSKGTCKEALDFVTEYILTQATGNSSENLRAAIATAIGVYHNTLLKSLAADAFEKAELQKIKQPNKINKGS